MARRWVLAIAAALLVAGPVAQAQPAPPEPYVDPPFAGDCEFRHYGEGEAPPLDDLPDDDPLCVEYEKEDITLAGEGAAMFLLAEPARVAAALDKCQYWQVDHWSIQVAADTVPIVRWDGSYWFDRGAGTGAVRMTNLELGGQPASPHEVADALEALSAELADGFRQYGDETGGGGMSFSVGGGDPACAAQPQPEPEAEPQPEPQPEPEAAPSPAPALPTTGGGIVIGLLLLAAGGTTLRR